MKLQELFEAANEAPKMQFPGCKVTMLIAWKSRLLNALKKLGYEAEQSGEEDSSTKYSVAFSITKKFNINTFEKELRKELNFDGYLEVQYFDLVEE